MQRSAPIAAFAIQKETFLQAAFWNAFDDKAYLFVLVDGLSRDLLVLSRLAVELL